ncbi:SMU1112c/YaeR family gloxylase I-like metalloprotein [Sphingobacterium wenxiniae]|uniref:Glyoxylase I family protein n=1 Tax=Sphingobacterium wenxiniae TaxID=683125 RepID=A0A1I6Q7T0_9SPHI|nr:VOC family protein [Sphingobacterium wenxiniae]SFS48531.1 glyoxylase I family protein [Sphingobacterium wenxiniae]
MINILRVHHIAIICSDYRKSLSFYTEVLGFKLLVETYREERDSYKADLALSGQYIIELFSFPNPPERLSFPEATGLRHLAFAVKDVEVVRNELLSLDVSVEEIRVDEGTGKRFFFTTDPDGLPLEFYEK